jgi:hypothetical protein
MEQYMEDDMTYDERTLALIGMLAEAKVKAKEVFDLECELLQAMVEHVDGGLHETLH